MMSYYRRLLDQNRDGGPSFREANDDFVRMLDAQYGVMRPLSDNRVRRHR
ncbi:MAG: hypothetical protein O3A10_11185 [Chloroflexi bacterium]|nr:hypothetical protein [Chloroflexota bacterium]MDA1146980.1 hypothetical protein [Chloroflexota bacterium]